MIYDLISLASLAVIIVVLLWFVPPAASRTWAVGLLVFMVVVNASNLIGAVIAHFSPPTLYLDAEKHQLRFNRGEKGELYGVQVDNPPEECRSFGKQRPWSLATGNLAVAALALVFLRRSPAETSGPREQVPAGTPAGS